MNRSKEACHCRNITYGMIEDAIKNGAETFQEVQDATGAAKGCGQCKDYLPADQPVEEYDSSDSASGNHVPSTMQLYGRSVS